EEQDGDADLGEELDDLADRAVGGDDAEHAPAEHDARQQLAEHRGLSDTLGQLAEDLAEDQDRDEDEEEVLGSNSVVHLRRAQQEREEEKRQVAKPASEHRAHCPGLWVSPGRSVAAGAAVPSPPAHHWDCAPSTICWSRCSIACSRPTWSVWVAAYCPRPTSPWLFQRITGGSRVTSIMLTSRVTSTWYSRMRALPAASAAR